MGTLTLHEMMIESIKRHYLGAIRANTRKGDRAHVAEALLRCTAELWLEERSRADLAAMLRALAAALELAA